MSQPYDFHMETLYAPVERIDVPKLARENQPWWNQTLTQVNDCVVRLGVIEGDFHWHKHEDEDEFFFVLEGVLEIEVEGGKTIVLHPHEGTTIPKGVMHFPHAKGRVVMLMVEGSGVQPAGD